MRQCAGTTKKGRRCRIEVTGSDRYCGIHAPEAIDVQRIGLTAIGAVIGTAVQPGLGSVIGGAIGHLADRFLVANPGKKRVFVSFDYDYDLSLKHFIVGQSRHERSPFEIVDCSLQEEQPDEEWVDHAIAAISGADLVMVMLGPYTYRARGVRIEVEIARRLGVKCVQIRGYSDRDHRPVDGGGRVYDWNWDNLDRILN